MCTLALSLGVDRRWPVVLAANRDERPRRLAEGWALRSTPGGGRMVAPRDLLAGGTWIGVSSTGLLAAITNHYAPGGRFPDPRRRSRGELVPLALEAPSVEAAAAALGALDPAAFNPFHLVVADGSGGLLWWYDGDDAALERLGAGLHLVTEVSAHGAGPRGDLLRSRWPVELAGARLREVLALHAPPHPAATCVHREPLYGTRSSAILRLPRDLAHAELLVADGHPCLAPFEDRSTLLAALARTA